MANRTRNGKKTIELRNDQIIFRFPEIYGFAELAIESAAYAADSGRQPKTLFTTRAWEIPAESSGRLPG